MGRMGKFTFSLTGRKSSGAEGVEEKQDEHPWEPSMISQDKTSLSKVERLLGTTGLPVRPSPSYDTLRLAALGAGSSQTNFASDATTSNEHSISYTESTDHASNYPHPPRYQSLRAQASSNALGLSEPGHVANQVAESSTSYNTRDLRSKYSSNTLQSYYDSHRAPLLVSQQTSESAVRDMALRKGLTQVIPVEDNEAEGHAPGDTDVLRQNSAADLTEHMPREQQTRKLDITSLFPRPRTSGHNASASSDLFKSPSRITLASDYQAQRRHVSSPSSPVRKGPRSYGVLQKRKPTGGKLTKRPSNASNLGRSEPYDNPKNNVRRPPKGIQNWFDGMLEEVDDEYGTDEEEQVPEAEPPQLSVRRVSSTASTSSEGSKLPPQGASRYFKKRPHFQRRKDSTRNLHPNPLRSHPLDKRFEAFSSVRDVEAEDEAHFGASDTSDEARSRSTTISESPQQSLQQHTNTSSRPQNIMQVLSNSPQRTTTSRRSLNSHRTVASGSTRTKLSDIDLQTCSALSLTSSSSEAEDEVDDGDLDSQIPAVRDSIALSEFSTDHILIGKARAFEISTAHRGLNDSRRAPRPTNLRELRPHSIIEELPPEPHSAGATTSAVSTARTLRDFAASEKDAELTRPHTSGADIAGISRASIYSVPGRRTSMLSEHPEMGGYGHKLMAVTPEEEALLEMMRSKRVAMATHSFKEGYKTALEQEERRKNSRSSSANHDTILAAVDAMMQASSTKRQSQPHESSSQQQVSPSLKDSSNSDGSDDAKFEAESTLTEIMDAFPAPSPTHHQFPSNSLAKNDLRNGSPGPSAASSSKRGTVKRHSTLSTVSSSREDTSQTSISSSSPIQKQDLLNADNVSISGDLSNASTVKARDAMHRLSLAQVDVSLGSFSRPTSVSESQLSPRNCSMRESRQLDQDRFGELTIGAHESLVGDKPNTDDLNTPRLHEQIPAREVASAPPETIRPRSDELSHRTAEPQSTAVDDTKESRNRLSDPAPLQSNRKFAERRVSKGAEYRLIPRISQVSPTVATFPPIIRTSNGSAQLQNISRIVSIPTSSQSGSADAISSGRPRLVSIDSAPAPNVSRAIQPEASKIKAKPRTINIANVKRAFSSQRDPAPLTSPLQRAPSDSVRISKRFSRSSLHGRPAEGMQRSSVSEDVLNAWSSLGGWKGFEALRGEAQA